MIASPAFLPFHPVPRKHSQFSEMYASEVFVLQEPVRLRWKIASLERILSLPVKDRPAEPPVLDFPGVRFGL